MGRAVDGMSGLALGTWGSVQAVAAGTAVAFGGILRDVVGGYAGTSIAGYDAVYLLEISLLFATLVALGPLVRREAKDFVLPTTTVGLTLAGE
jgi:BCD family chlorophyll transporter-like MFS transporter